MTEVVIAIVLLGVGTYTTRRTGVALGGQLSEGPGAERATRLLDQGIIALLIGVAATAAVYDGVTPGGWARPVGVGLALLAAWLRAPLVVSVLVGAGATALLRLAGVA